MPRACWKKGFSPYGDYYDNLGGICRNPSSQLYRNYTMLAVAGTVCLVLLAGWLILVYSRFTSFKDFARQLEESSYPADRALPEKDYSDKRTSVLLSSPGSHPPPRVLRYTSPGSSAFSSPGGSTLHTPRSSPLATPQSQEKNNAPEEFPFPPFSRLAAQGTTLDENAARRLALAKRRESNADLVPNSVSSRRSRVALGRSPLSYGGAVRQSAPLSGYDLNDWETAGWGGSLPGQRTSIRPVTGWIHPGGRTSVVDGRQAHSSAPASDEAEADFSDWGPAPTNNHLASETHGRPNLPRPHSAASRQTSITFDLSSSAASSRPSLVASHSTSSLGLPQRRTHQASFSYSHSPSAFRASPSLDESLTVGEGPKAKTNHARTQSAGVRSTFRRLLFGSETSKDASLPLSTFDIPPPPLDAPSPPSLTRYRPHTLTPPLQTTTTLNPPPSLHILPSTPSPDTARPSVDTLPLYESSSSPPASPSSPRRRSGFVVNRQRTYSVPSVETAERGESEETVVENEDEANGRRGGKGTLGISRDWIDRQAAREVYIRRA